MSDTFCKVVRPDLASFSDPEFVYQIGGTHRPTVRIDNPVLCRAGLLHASREAPEAARYGTWPYRLLEVTGRPVIEQEDKAGFLQLKVVGERDVSECFGPNGSDVVNLLHQAEAMTAEQAQRLVAAWSAARDAAWYAAWYAAGDAALCAAWYAALYAAWYAAGDAAWDAAWYAAGDAAGDAAWYAAGDAAGDAAWYAARDAARYAARDAARDVAGALAIADLIGQHGFTQTHFDTLTKPWFDVMGDPR